MVTQQGLSGQAKSASLVGNFTSADFLRGRGEDMPSLVRDILSGNVIVRIDTIKFPLGIVAGKLSPNLPGPIPIKCNRGSTSKCNSAWTYTNQKCNRGSTSKCNSAWTYTNQKCNRGSTSKCNSAWTYTNQKCNRGSTSKCNSAWTYTNQKCNRGSTSKCNSAVLK